MNASIDGIRPEDIRITYTTANADLSVFHAFFDAALDDIRGRAGQTWPMHIGGEELVSDAPTIIDTAPADTREVLGYFQAGKPEHADLAVKAARGAFKAWASKPWQDRVTIMREAANVIRRRKFELAAMMALEVGKNRFEAIGDAEESADLIDYYCQQMVDHDGYIQELGRITPIETNTDVLRPYGVFACIAPFNFPAALSFGMSSAALVAGNTIVYKPATDTPWTGLLVYDMYREAGVPAGVFNFFTGRGRELGDSLTGHPGLDGVVFTGSKAVGMQIFHNLSRDYVKPCLMELGGKNPAIVMATADLDAAAEGVAKSAWGLQNQKCSACSRVYVHEAVYDDFLARLIARTGDIVIGDPADEGVYFGPVINARAVATYEKTVARARAEGEILVGGGRLTDGDLAHGHYVAPTIAVVPTTSDLFREEFFVPFLAVGKVAGLDEALALANDCEYGLTAGIFSGKPEEVARFFDEIEAGVTYANKRTGATTGAWPGAQAFCGWKGSGGSGKGGCGPYYVAQFMREQCRTLIRE